MTRQSGSKRGSAELVAISEKWAASVTPRRQPGAHKWEVGGLLVVAGSPAYAGAAVLCCASAGRSGAGIVSAAMPRSIVNIVIGQVPEATVVVLPEGESNSAATRAATAVMERLDRCRAMVIGPGLGSDEASAALLGALFGSARARATIGFGARPGGSSEQPVSLVASAEKPMVVDADGLNWLAEQEDWWVRFPGEQLVLTPHAGEMARLIARPVDEVLADPDGAALDAAERWGQVVVLKGAKTYVASPGGAVRYAESPPALATAGSGDVLSGSIGAFLAQGVAPADAAALAVYVGSRAAERLAARLGTLGVIASDLPLAIAEELRALEQMEA